MGVGFILLPRLLRLAPGDRYTGFARTAWIVGVVVGSSAADVRLTRSAPGELATH
jgi:hypothetical protein